jgi:hypothetical protein
MDTNFTGCISVWWHQYVTEFQTAEEYSDLDPIREGEGYPIK